MVAMRSLSLTLSSAASANVVVPSAEAAATASTGISSISDGTSAPPTSVALQRAVPGPDGRPSWWPGRGRSTLDVGAHAPQHVEEAGPPGADVDVLDDQVAARRDARGHDPEGGLGRVARHVQVEAAAAAEGRTVTGPGATRRCRAPHSGQHLLGVGPGRDRPRARSSRPSAARPASSTAPLTWALGHRQAVVDAVQAAAPHDQRRQLAAVAAVDAGPHGRSGLDDPVHGPAGDGRVAGRTVRPSIAGGPAGQEPDAGARVARRRSTASGSRSRPAPPSTTTSPAGRRRRPRRRSCARPGGCAATSAPSDSPADPGRPSARAASSRARWEIDLSPGTRSRPCSPPAATGRPTKVRHCGPSRRDRAAEVPVVQGLRGPGRSRRRRRPAPARPARLRRCGRSRGRRC